MMHGDTSCALRWSNSIDSAYPYIYCSICRAILNKPPAAFSHIKKWKALKAQAEWQWYKQLKQVILKYSSLSLKHENRCLNLQSCLNRSNEDKFRWRHSCTLTHTFINGAHLLLQRREKWRQVMFPPRLAALTSLLLLPWKLPLISLRKKRPHN